ncbi:hypothetical protein HD806DRAFT_510655 [Xylariaceae sp. AK1471]|nr:hypothetical protein HD806DRAFT_510655 [Xylariaceae sp. AK1471]
MHFASLAVAPFVAYYASAQSATPGVLTGLPTLTATPTYRDAACNSSITSYIEGIPTPPPAFTEAPDFNYVASDLEEICVVEAELSSSLLSAYTSYNNAVSSYIREKIPDLEEIRSICPPRNGSRRCCCSHNSRRCCCSAVVEMGGYEKWYKIQEVPYIPRN